MANVFFLAVFPAHAQNAQGIRNPYGIKQDRNIQQNQIIENFNGTGTIEAVATGKIQMVTDLNERWLIGIQPQTQVHVTGNMNADFLCPGMFVQFKADVDKRGIVSGKVEQLAVITPSQDKPSGIVPQPGASIAGHEGSDDDKTRAAVPSTVRGQISKYQKNKLHIKVDKKTLICDLSNNAKISVDLDDYSLARRGDKIKVQGMKMGGVAGSVQAMQVKIDLIELPVATKKKSSAAKTDSHSSKSAKSKPSELLPATKDDR
jgi:hypothetical protein